MSVFHGGKLKPLDDELKKLRPREVRKQTPEEMLAAMRAIKATMGG